MFVFTMCLWVAGASWLLYRAITRWRDQPTGKTIAYLAGAWALLIVPVFAVTESEIAMLALVCMALGFAGWAVVTDLRRRPERLESRENAVAAGMDPREAHRLFRRPPRHSFLILLIYAGAAMAFVFACVGATTVLGLDPQEPSIRLSSGEGEPPYDMPW